jgi:hypothetical protein
VTAKRPVSTELVAKPYYSVPSALELCDDVLGLSDKAYRLLHQLCALHDGFNNGHLQVSRQVFRAMGWRTHRVLDKALTELLSAGLVVQTRPPNSRAPRLFALAWLRISHRDGLINPPDLPFSLPDDRATQRALKIARRESQGELLSWSLQNCEFAGSPVCQRKNLAGTCVVPTKRVSWLPGVPTKTFRGPCVVPPNGLRGLENEPTKPATVNRELGGGAGGSATDTEDKAPESAERLARCDQKRGRS